MTDWTWESREREDLKRTLCFSTLIVGGEQCHDIFFKDFIYLFMRDTEREGGREREAETQAEGEAGSMQGA